MKKIFSILLSISLVMTMMSTMVFANTLPLTASASIDVNSTEGATFKNFVGDSFDENYFFMGTFVAVTNSDVTKLDGTKKLVLEDDDDELQFDCNIAWYPYLESENIGCMGLGEDAVTTLKTGESAVIADGIINNLFFGRTADDLYPMTTFGVALKDSSTLTKDTTVTMKIVNVVDEEETVLGQISHTFEAPVSFSHTELADFASVLKDLNNGKEVEASVVVSALSKVTSEDAKNELIVATNATEDEEAKISEENIKALANLLSGAVTVSTNNTSSDKVKVSMPYATLATGSDVEINVADAEQIEGVTVAEGQVGLSLDISLKANGTEIQPLIPQTVEIELPANFAKGENKKVTVYHKTSDDYREVDVVGGKISFKADSFSTFTLVGDEIVITEENLAEEVAVVIERQKDADGEDTNIFNIGIKPDGVNASSTAIVNFVDATFGLRITKGDMVSCEYKLRDGKDGIIVDAINNGSYDGVDKLVDINFLAQVPGGREGTASVTKGLGETLWVAELEVNGIGNATLVVGGIDLGARSDYNVIYTEVGQSRTKATTLNQATTNIEIKQKKHKIDIEIEFANALSEAKFADVDWLGMEVVFENRLTGDKQTAVVGNGTDENVNYLTLRKSIDAEGLEVSTATGSVELIANNNYIFEVTGAGFRTYRGSILADDDKEIKLWNNARYDKADGTVTSEEVVEGDGNPVYKNFLVGDIYMDGIVDIYDLSAVTSYYAPKKDVTADKKFAAYDLNRDGIIDAADIAYVQVSYGN